MDKTQDLINKLKIKEKISLLIGKDYWATNDIKRLNIESIITSDGPHGLRKQDGNTDNIGFNASEKATCFPTAATLACSFDKDLLYKTSSLLSYECKNQGVDILLGPGVNIKRHPLCGRNFEYYSEDPLLSGKLAANFVKGLEDNNIGTCVKHFALNNQEYRRQISNSVVDINTMHNLYLKPFKIIINEAKPTAIMSSYNLINGIYASENEYLLKDVLRNELSYQGIVISDWGALSDETLSFINGLNLEMPGVDKTRKKFLLKQYKKGKITDSDIDKAIYPLVNYAISHTKEYSDVDYLNHYQEAVNIADECSVLIKNDDFLPLNKNEKILIIGDFAYDIRFQGGGSSNVFPYKLEQINEITKDYSNNITCIKGYDNKTGQIIDEDLEKIKENINSYEKIIYICGLTIFDESEGYDRSSFEISTSQRDLYEILYNLNNNIGVVCLGGSPFNANFLTNAKSILLKYLSGEAQARSIMNTLYGKANPSGRLAETWPSDISLTPLKEYPEKDFSVLYTEGEYVGYKYYNLYDIKPLFPFGSGMSYSKHNYYDFNFNSETNEISFTLENVSNINGKEVIQLYLQTIDKKYISLVYFDKISLSANEKKKITIKIDNSFFMQYDSIEKKDTIHSGEFFISVRKNSLESLFEFKYKNDLGKPFTTPSNHINLEKISSNNQTKGYYNLNSTITDFKSCFLGKIFNKIIDLIIIIYVKKHPSLKRVIDESIKTSPIRIFTLGTNGFISYCTLKRIVKLMNGFKKRI